MRIAVVSSNKVEVNGSFGQSDRFLIYEKKKEGLFLLGERFSEPMVVDYPDREMCDWIADIIQDCQEVYMARICKVAERAVASRGITPVVYQGPIDQISC